VRSLDLRLALCLGLVPLLGGCAGTFGLLYSHTRQPLTTDFHRTPASTQTASGDTKQIDYYVRVLWSGNAIGEIARKHGFETVNYADLETLRVLGVWTQQWAHVYGTRRADADGSGQ
jgi:TRL-like protein family